MSTMYNQSANGYSAGGGGGGPGYAENPPYNEQGEPFEEDEFGRTEEGKQKKVTFALFSTSLCTSLIV